MENFTCLRISDEMIRRHIAYTKDEYNKDQTPEEALAELENLKSKGCLLYDDCRSCPKFGKCCPL